MVKQYNEEVDPRCDLVLDHSASMSVPPEKGAAALGVAAILAVAAENAGFTLSLWHAAGSWEREPFPGRPQEWKVTDFASDGNPGDTIASFAGGWQRRGIRILISDLLWPEAPRMFLRRLCEGARRVIVIRIEPEEHFSPDENGSTTLADPETGELRELLIDDDTLGRYRSRRNSHRELWQRAADEAGAEIIDISPDVASGDWGIPLLLVRGIIKY